MRCPSRGAVEHEAWVGTTSMGSGAMVITRSHGAGHTAAMRGALPSSACRCDRPLTCLCPCLPASVVRCAPAGALVPPSSSGTAVLSLMIMARAMATLKQYELGKTVDEGRLVLHSTRALRFLHRHGFTFNDLKVSPAWRCGGGGVIPLFVLWSTGSHACLPLNTFPARLLSLLGVGRTTTSWSSRALTASCSSWPTSATATRSRTPRL